MVMYMYYVYLALCFVHVYFLLPFTLCMSMNFQMQLYVWDESDYVPLLVKNKAAELLFGNMSAERVYSCFRGQQNGRNPDQIGACKAISTNELEALGVSGALASSCSVDVNKSLEFNANVKDMNYYVIWLILLKSLLQQEKNSPLKFEISVNPSVNSENGRFEMVSMWMPCFRTKFYPDKSVSLINGSDVTI